jgi:hypothetical protein
MKHEDIIRMAETSGFEDSLMYEHWRCNLESITQFAKLVEQHEREACAKLEIELILSPVFFATMGEYDAHKDAVLAYRNLIRARGQG